MAQKVCLIKSTFLCLLYVIHLIHLIQRTFFFTQIKNFSQDFYMILFGTSFVTFFCFPIFEILVSAYPQSGWYICKKFKCDSIIIYFLSFVPQLNGNGFPSGPCM